MSAATVGALARNRSLEAGVDRHERRGRSRDRADMSPMVTGCSKAGFPLEMTQTATSIRDRHRVAKIALWLGLCWEIGPPETKTGPPGSFGCLLPASGFVKMLRIVTDVEGASAHPEPRSRPSLSRLWRSRRPALAVVAATTLSLVPALALSGPSHGATIGSLQAQANHLEQEIASTSAEIGALGQRYDQAKNQLESIDGQIAATRTKIASDQQHVATDKVHLRSAAIDAYISDGSAAQNNPLFSGNQRTYAAQQEYGQIAAGNLNVEVADLHSAEVQLNTEKANLLVQQGAAQSAVNAAFAAQQQANAEQAQLNSQLGQVKGELGVFGARRRGVRQRLGVRPDPGGAGQRRELPAPAAQQPRWRRGGGGRDPARRALRVGRRVARPRVRLLGADRVGVGPGRRVAPPLLGRTVRGHGPGAGVRPRAG